MTEQASSIPQQQQQCEEEVNVDRKEGVARKNGSNARQTDGSAEKQNMELAGIVSSRSKKNAVAKGTEDEDVMNEDDNQVDYIDVTIHNNAHANNNAEEEVSTIYGGRYNPTMHACSTSTQRMEDRLGYMRWSIEKGDVSQKDV